MHVVLCYFGMTNKYSCTVHILCHITVIVLSYYYLLMYYYVLLLKMWLICC